MYNSIGGSTGDIKKMLKAFSCHLSSNIVITLTWTMALSLALAPLLGWSYYEPESNGLRQVNSRTKRR